MPGGCYAQEATDRNRALVLYQYVRLAKDVSETDRYGRLLRCVYARDTFVNAELVRGGYAVVYTVPPDVAYADYFLRLQAEAMSAGRGLWAVCFRPTATPTLIPMPTQTLTPTGTVTPSRTAPWSGR
jgi:endonuclease YncB( thermonuclease family)